MMRNALKNAALVIVSCLATLLVSEAILRFAAHRLLRGGEWLAAGQIFKIIDPPVGFSLLPGSTQILVTGKAYTSRADINSAGLRDIEHPSGKPPGQRRILVLGDSFMFGQGVRMQESLPRQLAGQMPGVDVINAGIPGYNLGQEYLYFKDRGYRCEPDLVLLGFFINDLARARELDETDGPDGLPVSYQRTAQMLAHDRQQAPHGLRGAVSSFLNSHSLLYVLVRRHMENLVAHHGPAAVKPGDKSENKAEDKAEDKVEDKVNAEPYYLSVFRDDASQSVARDWEQAYRILDELKRDVTSRGARLAVILVPAPFQISDKEFHDWLEWSGAAGQAMSRRKPQDMVLAWCRKTATPCDDLLETFENQDREKYYYPYDLHWTSQGHQLAARSVAGFLVANHLP